jgi:hypothetical protein
LSDSPAEPPPAKKKRKKPVIRHARLLQLCK